MSTHRIEVATDIAQIGAWDCSRGANIIGGCSDKKLQQQIKSDADSGHVFMLQLGGDWGGAVDVHVNSEPDPDVRRDMQTMPGEFLLAVPTGRLMVSGMEDYRAAEARVSSATSRIEIAPGDYAVRCLLARDSGAEIPDMPEPQEIENMVGKEAYAYYRAGCDRSVRGFWLLLLFLPLTYWLGWIIGLVATLVIVIGYFNLMEWLLERDPRFQAVNQRVEAAREAVLATMPALLALQLRPVTDQKLTGGVLDLSESF